MQDNRPYPPTTRARLLPALALIGTAAALAACSQSAVSLDSAARRTPLALPPDGLLLSSEASTAVAVGPSLVGLASWYRRGPSLQRTCTGEPLSDDRLFAASSVVPMGTEVRVTLLYDDRSVIVRVNDCMPRGHRIIDLTEEAARELGLIQSGVALVRVTPVAWR